MNQQLRQANTARDIATDAPDVGIAPGKHTHSTDDGQPEGNREAAQETDEGADTEGMGDWLADESLLAAIGLEPQQPELEQAHPPPLDELAGPIQLRAGGEPAAQKAEPTNEGRPLEPGLRRDMERSFSSDFSAVRVHEGGHAAALGAQAYTRGVDLHFAPGQYAPETPAGRDLLGHELAHVVQQAQGRVQAPTQSRGLELHQDEALEREADEQGARAARGEPARMAGSSLPAATMSTVVQARIRPQDVAEEMVGRDFRLSAAVGRLAIGTVVRPTAWDNASRTVPVRNNAGLTATVPKSSLRPVSPGTAGMHRYSAGVAGQAASAESADQTVAAWRARESEYSRNRELWTAELTRLEDLAARRHDLLNQRLIQETQFNRFDPIIKSEVDAANAAAGYTGTAALDPNLLKSMIFQETQMGTAGEHLGDPSHPVKTRFNLGQTIDSSGSQLLLLMEREHPALLSRFFLTSLRADLETARQRKTALERMRTRTAAQQAELDALTAGARQNWEHYIWSYRAAGRTVSFANAVTELFRSPGPGRPARNEDYQFWIHLMVMWLFEKRRAVPSWSDAIRAYNGSGTRANHYREVVIARRDEAAAATRGGTDFVPDRI